MKEQIDYSLLVDRFMNGELKEDELNWFEDEKRENKSLAAEIRLQYEIGASILEDEEMGLRVQLLKIEKEMTPRKSRNLKFGSLAHSSAAAVASVILILVIGAWLYFGQVFPVSNARLFDQYYEPYTSLSSVRSGNLAMDNILEVAMQKYEQGEFAEALPLFEQVLINDSQDATSRFYQGIAFMETDKFKSAGHSFHSVIEHKDNLFIEQAQWYLGLCYLRTDENDKARIQFERIAMREGVYVSNARKILRALR